jgi:hypothetical protein
MTMLNEISQELGNLLGPYVGPSKWNSVRS